MEYPATPSRVVRLATRAYQSFLVLYPAVFRAEYEQDMKAFFEERCLELYETSGTVGIGRWLIKILVTEATSVYKEHLNVMTYIFQYSQITRRTVGVGAVFLVGTWMGLFHLMAKPVTPLIDRITDSTTQFMVGLFLVLVNTLLVVRSLMRSTRPEYVAGVVAMANTFLIAGLLAVQTAFGSLPYLAVLAQIVLILLHWQLLWRVRGEDLIQSLPEVALGE